MKYGLALACACVALAQPLVVEQQRVVDPRLKPAKQPAKQLLFLETAPGLRELVRDEEEMLDMKRAGINFLDVTAEERGLRSVARVGAAHKNATYPAKVHERKLFEKLQSELSKAELEVTLTRFTSFYTRYARSQSGRDSSNWLYDKVLELVGDDRDDVTVRQVEHDWLQRSLIVSINGTQNPDKVVVVGSHQDSINLLLPAALPAPGADDDGSGSMTILEVLRVLLEAGFRPKNTLEFHWYSAEELGLLGSQDVYADYAARNVDVRAMLQQDMTGYSAGSKHAKDGRDELGVITDFVDPALTEFVKLVISEYCAIPYVETACGYACSDHSSASKYGYQSAFVIESEFKNSDKKIHTTEDKVEYLDFDHMLEHAKLTLGYALELGNYKDL